MIWIVAMVAVAIVTFNGIFGTAGHDGFLGHPLGWLAAAMFAGIVSFLFCIPLLGAATFIGSLPGRVGIRDQTYPWSRCVSKTASRDVPTFWGLATSRTFSITSGIAATRTKQSPAARPYATPAPGSAKGLSRQ